MGNHRSSILLVRCEFVPEDQMRYGHAALWYTGLPKYEKKKFT